MSHRTGLQINGEVPDLVGLVCEGLLCQEYRHEGKVENPANVVFLQFGGVWHRVWFDADMVFWRNVHAPDSPVTIDKWTYTLIDVGERIRVHGVRLSDMRLADRSEAAELRLTFENGTVLTFENEYGADTCSWSVAYG